MARALSREALDRPIYLFIYFIFCVCFFPPLIHHICAKTFKMFHLCVKCYVPNVLEHLKNAHLRKLMGFVSKRLQAKVQHGAYKMWRSDADGMFTVSKLKRAAFERNSSKILWEDLQSLQINLGRNVVSSENLWVFHKSTEGPTQNASLPSFHMKLLLHTMVLENLRVCLCALSHRGEFHSCQSAFKPSTKSFFWNTTTAQTPTRSHWQSTFPSFVPQPS